MPIAEYHVSGRCKYCGTPLIDPRDDACGECGYPQPMRHLIDQCDSCGAFTEYHTPLHRDVKCVKCGKVLARS